MSFVTFICLSLELCSPKLTTSARVIAMQSNVGARGRLLRVVCWEHLRDYPEHDIFLRAAVVCIVPQIVASVDKPEQSLS